MSRRKPNEPNARITLVLVRPAPPSRARIITARIARTINITRGVG